MQPASFPLHRSGEMRVFVDEGLYRRSGEMRSSRRSRRTVNLARQSGEMRVFVDEGSTAGRVKCEVPGEAAGPSTWPGSRVKCEVPGEAVGLNANSPQIKRPRGSGE